MAKQKYFLLLSCAGFLKINHPARELKVKSVTYLSVSRYEQARQQAGSQPISRTTSSQQFDFNARRGRIVQRRGTAYQSTVLRCAVATCLLRALRIPILRVSRLVVVACLDSPGEEGQIESKRKDPNHLLVN